MIFNKNMTISALVILIMGLCAPMRGAQKVVDEKQEKQEQELKAKVLALLDVQDERVAKISFINIPESIKLKDKQGKIVDKEFLSLRTIDYIEDEDGKKIEIEKDADESLTCDSYRSIIQEQLKIGKPAIIARVVIHDGSKLAAKYYDVSELLRALAVKKNKDPLTRKPILSLSYFSYSPDFEGLMFVGSGYKLPVAGQPMDLITLPEVEDNTRCEMALYLNDGFHCKKDSKKAREIFEDVSANARVPYVKMRAQRALSEMLYFGIGGATDYKKARELFEFFMTQSALLPPDKITRLCVMLAIEYYENRAQLPVSGQCREQTWEYVQKVLADSEFFNNSTNLYTQTAFYLVAGALHYAGTGQHKPDYEQAEKLLHKALECVSMCKKDSKKSNEAQARVHALLGCVYYEDTTPRADRYTQAIYHFGKAIKICNNQKHVFKEVIDALPYMAEIDFYGIGTERCPKKALNLIERYKKQNPGKELPERMKNIIGFHEQFKAADEQARKKADYQVKAGTKRKAPSYAKATAGRDNELEEAPDEYIVGPSPLSKS